MNQNLGIPINPLIELLVRQGSIVNIDFVTDNEAGFSTTGDYEVTKVAVVFLDIALASSERETLSCA